MDKYEPIKWPSWRYGPNGEAEIFESEAEVPEGWLDHPAKFKKKEGKNEAVAPASEGESNSIPDGATSPVEPSSTSSKKSSKSKKK